MPTSVPVTRPPAVSALRTRAARRRALGDFLRRRRDALSQGGDAPDAGRRRAPGLRREDVADRARVSVGYYTWLEQGRDVTPSPAVVAALVTALELDLAASLYVRALLAEPVPAPAPVDPAVLGRVQEVVAATGTDDLPVFAISDEGLVVAVDDAVAGWYPGLGPSAQPDLLLWTFGAAGRAALVGWESSARELVRRTRFGIAPHGLSPVIGGAIRSLHATDADFRRWWDEHEVALPGSVDLEFATGGASSAPRRLRMVPLRPVDPHGVTIALHLARGGPAVP